MNTNTNVTVRLTIPELVREFDLGMHELKQGIALVTAAQERLQKAFAGPGGSYDLTAFAHHDHSLDFEKKRIRMRGAAWRYLVSRAEIKKVASIKRAKEIDDMLAKPETLPEITINNVMGWVESLNDQSKQFLEEAAVEVYQWLRPARGDYKTNNAFKIGKRVVLTYMIEGTWMGRGLRVRYGSEDRLRALDNVFHLLDGKGLSSSYAGELADAIPKTAAGEFGETTFFRFRPFRNGNLHLEFKRPDLVQRLNLIGGKGLPVA
jgi:hypothetical protein